MATTSRHQVTKKIEDLSNTVNTRPNKHIKNTSFCNSRVHTLLKYTWSIIQNRPHVRSQNNS